VKKCCGISQWVEESQADALDIGGCRLGFLRSGGCAQGPRTEEVSIQTQQRPTGRRRHPFRRPKQYTHAEAADGNDEGRKRFRLDLGLCGGNGDPVSGHKDCHASRCKIGDNFASRLLRTWRPGNSRSQDGSEGRQRCEQCDGCQPSGGTGPPVEEFGHLNL